MMEAPYVQSRRQVELGEVQNRELEYERQTEGSADIEGTSFVASIADDVIAISLPHLFERRGAQIPEEYALYRKAYDLWLVPHRVGILRKSGLREITSVRVESRFEVGKKTCAIISLFPQSKFVNAGSLSFQALVDVKGQGSVGPASPVATPLPELGLSVGVSGGVSASLAFQAAVLTPVIQAIGEGTREAQWLFEQDKLPLYGSDLVMWSVLLLPRLPVTKKISYKLKAHITHRVFVFPTVWSSPETDVTCTLLRD